MKKGDLGTAIAITANAFEGRYDKGGQPYILHCLHVMNQMPADDSDLRIIAVLHDIIEDTEFELEDLKEFKFSDRVVWGVQALTHLDDEPYMTYIKRVSFNEDAVRVKKADLEHNSNIMRMKGLRKKDFDRLEKYHIAYEYLSS